MTVMFGLLPGLWPGIPVPVVGAEEWLTKYYDYSTVQLLKSTGYRDNCDESEDGIGNEYPEDSYRYRLFANRQLFPPFPVRKWLIFVAVAVVAVLR